MRTIYLRLAAFLGITTLTLISCEVALRVAGFYPSYQITIKGLTGERATQYFSPHPKKLFVMKPSRARGINSSGYRDKEFAREKREGVTRIAVLGDSFTMGLAVGSEETFPKLLESELGAQVEVLNFGIQGYGPDQELAVLTGDVLPLTPDLVILAIFPGNDFHDLLKNGLFSVNASGQVIDTSSNPVLENIPPLRLPMLMRLLITKHYLDPQIEKSLDAAFFQDPVRVLIKTEGADTIRARKIFSNIVSQFKQIARAHAIKFFALIIPSYESIQNDERFVMQSIPKDRYFANEELAREVIEEQAVAVLDLSPYFLAWRAEELYTNSDRHLSQAGHRLTAALLAKFVGSLL